MTLRYEYESTSHVQSRAVIRWKVLTFGAIKTIKTVATQCACIKRDLSFRRLDRELESIVDRLRMEMSIFMPPKPQRTDH